MASSKELTINRTLKASPSTVWRVIADYGNVADWNPNLKSAQLLDGPARGVGARRQCNMKDGKNYVREVVRAWQEGRSMTIDVYEGTMPFDSASVSIAVQEAVGHTTQLRFTMRYTPRAGIGGAIMGVMAKPMLKRIVGSLLDGLEAKAGYEAPLPLREAVRA